MWFGTLAWLVAGCGGPKMASPDADADGDGYTTDDCNDADPRVQPGALEACNGVDDDCDGEIDEDVILEWYPDIDGDGYGADDEAVSACDCPDGDVGAGGDCDDADPAVHPGAQEVCNGIDDDCTGGVSLEVDNDSDGISECEGDCLDTNRNVYPGAPESCDRLDDDCDGVLPADEADADRDGELICEGDCDDTDRTMAHANFEVCDGVDNDCSGDMDEDCWSCDLAVPNDYPTIQEGIDGASTGDLVCVGPGTWGEHLNFHGATITLSGVGGPAATILDGGGWSTGSVVVFDSAETPATELRGFTVRNGGSDDSDEPGGIEISGASPTLSDLIVTENTGWLGGGISVHGGDPSMTRLNVSGNYGWSGGGIYLSESGATLEDVVIEDNSGVDGGGLCATESTISLTNVRMAWNNASIGYGGGGAYFEGSEASLSNVLFADNSTLEFGAGLALNNSSATLTNVRFSGNDAMYDGGGVECIDSTAVFANAIFQDNASYRGDGGAIFLNRCTLTFSYSDVVDNYPDDFVPSGIHGNISIDPDLYDSLGHLSATSPLIDAGDPTILDPDGSPSDIGAYGGPGADSWDLDFDGYSSWWLPGPYDPATSAGLDCTDDDASVYPGAGC